MSAFQLTFDLKDFSAYIDLSRFQFLHVALNGYILAVATNKYLILTNGSSGDTGDQYDVRVVLEFREYSSDATCVVWITDDILCVGFESGYVLCFSTAGEEVFEYRGSKSSVQAVKLFHTINGKGPGLWILYEGGHLVYIPISQVLKGRSDSFLAFKFANHEAVNDFAFCPNFFVSSIFETDDDIDAHYNIFVCGFKSALSLYKLGGKLLQQDADKGASGKSSSMLSRGFMSLLGMASTDTGKKTDKAEEYARVLEKSVTVFSAVEFQDSKRRILRLSVEPCGTLIAAADSLGRVSLYETSTNTVVRVWKGLRDARLSWTHSIKDVAGEFGRENASLHLVVYAPQLGLVSVFRMVHGPCVRIVPVGMNAQLIMTVENAKDDFKVAKSFVLRSVLESGTVEMTEINPIDYADTDIDILSALLLQSGDLNTGEDFDFVDGDDVVGDPRVVESRALQKIHSNLTRLGDMLGSLSKASLVVRSQNIDLSNRVDESLTASIETVVLDLLSVCSCSFSGLLNVFQWVESIEVTGNLSYSSDSSREDAPSLCFSVGFHRRLLTYLSEACNDESSAVDEQTRESVGDEVRIRLKLLAAYEMLLDVQGHPSVSMSPSPMKEAVPMFGADITPQKDSFAVPSVSQQSVVEEAAMICRTNSSRAEALCWALRAGKKQNRSRGRNKIALKVGEQQLTSKGPRGPSTPPPANMQSKIVKRTPEPSGTSPVPGTGISPLVIHDGNSRSDSTTVKSIEAFSTHQNLLEVLFSDRPKADAPAINFSTFRLCHTNHGKLLSCEWIAGCLEGLDRRDRREQNTVLSESFFFELFGVQCDPPVQQLRWNPGARTARSLLGTVVSPLFGDLFSIHTYAIAAKQMGAGGPLGLKLLMPLFLVHVAQQPISLVVTQLLTKKLSTSTFQRWLRDTLLTFQDLVTSSAASAHSRIDFDGEEGGEGNNLESAFTEEADEEGQSVGNVSRSSSFSEESDYLTAITREIVEGRRNESDKSVPSYDEYVRYLLRPAWSQARHCANLEAVLAFASIVVETLLTVHEQVERRTYGACNLVMTMKAWENLIRQLRVALLLSSRIGLTDKNVTVEKLSSGSISLHKLLAADTLSFALKADQAIEHEERCQEVFNRRTAALSNSTPSGDGEHKSDVLLAWGKVADKRWRNLIEVALAEDTLEVEIQGGPDGKESDVDFREPEEGASHKRKPPVKRRRPLLLYFPKHSQLRFLGGYRGYILAERWASNLSHVYELSSASEHLFALPVNWRGAVAADIYRTFILPALRLFVILEEDANANQDSDDRQLTLMSQQLLVIIADISLLKTFIRSAVEILRFIENAVVNAKHLSSLNTDAEAVPDASSREYDDEEVESVWPSTTDKRLCGTYRDFFDREHRVRKEWTESVVKAHISILWVMQLRFQCGLRGIKPVKILGSDVMSCLSLPVDTSASTSEELVTDTAPIRLEFLKQCLRRLISVDPPVNVYKLAELWSMELNKVRLLHISALMERGNMDDEVELLVPQVTDRGAVVDTLTEVLRSRLGGIVARIDRLSIFGPLIASMDTEAISWARASLPAEFSPEPSVLEDIAKGRVKAVNINLVSTRNLVLSMQSILLAVPVVDRYAATPSEGGGGLTSSWLERKSKCDALLALCNSFSHLSSSGRSSK